MKGCGHKIGPFDCCTVVTGDCLDVMAKMPDGCVGLVVADAPYGIGYESARQTRMGGGARKNAPRFGKDEFDPAWLAHSYRVATKDSSLYLFSRWDVLGQWIDALKQASWHVTQRLVWDKAHWKMGDLRYYGSQTEDVLYCRKGTPTLQWEKRRGNLYRHSSFYLSEGQFDHPTQKPEALVGMFISDATELGNVVFDPFIGSGTTAVAAQKLGRHFFGCDINPEYVAMTEKRLSTVQLAMEL